MFFCVGLKYGILKMGNKLRVFKNRLMTKIFGSKREELTGHWGRLHYVELHNFHSRPIYFGEDKIRKNKIGSVFGTCGGEERFIQSFGGEI
jgi:hypothetical protein